GLGVVLALAADRLDLADELLRLLGLVRVGDGHAACRQGDEHAGGQPMSHQVVPPRWVMSSDEVVLSGRQGLGANSPRPEGPTLLTPAPGASHPGARPESDLFPAGARPRLVRRPNGADIPGLSFRPQSGRCSLADPV